MSRSGRSRSLLKAWRRPEGKVSSHTNTNLILPSSYLFLYRNGTSMISLIIPPKDQISRVSKMLADEFGTASNIKSRVNRLSVLGAITSVQHRLKLYTKVPPNGLVIYCGTIVTEEGKEKKVNIDFEPFKPINTSLYLCDNKFHTEALSALLADDNKFGFIIMDGNGALFGTLQGNTRDVLHKFTVDLPKKHGKEEIFQAIELQLVLMSISLYLK